MIYLVSAVGKWLFFAYFIKRSSCYIWFFFFFVVKTQLQNRSTLTQSFEKHPCSALKPNHCVIQPCACQVQHSRIAILQQNGFCSCSQFGC